MIKRFAGLILILVSLLSMSVHANHVKCKCPNIDASGTGDSSCSASETSGQCTIAFNEFDTDLERLARNTLQKSIRWRKIQFQELPPNRSFSKDNAAALSRNPEMLIDQLLVYSLVSLAERDNISVNDERIKAAHALLDKNAWQISRVFVGGNGKIQGGGLTVTLGCIAFRTGDFWIMYKAAWSTSISNDQC